MNFQPSRESLRIFVYGTLKPGGFYYQRYCLDKVTTAQPALAKGQLYHLPMGYPAMTLSSETNSEGTVQGFVLSFTDPSILKRLDELEGFNPEGSPVNNEYDRQLISIFSRHNTDLGMAWAYIMDLSQIQTLGGILLPTGNWLNNPQQ